KEKDTNEIYTINFKIYQQHHLQTQPIAGTHILADMRLHVGRPVHCQHGPLPCNPMPEAWRP
ncbi:MAG TPA: hypothetical protein VHX39_10610, partial [Acetobacteraceae bacterium]|nr:hypothetical protein [Acetobacteraceae bacterium]